jgi:hypothetical protein
MPRPSLFAPVGKAAHPGIGLFLYVSLAASQIELSVGLGTVPIKNALSLVLRSASGQLAEVIGQ